MSEQHDKPKSPQVPPDLGPLLSVPRYQQWLLAAWIAENGSLRGYPFKLKHVTEES